MTKPQQKRIGRPPGSDFPNLLHIRISDEMLAELRALAKDRMDKQPTAHVVRELLAEGLSQRKPRP